MTESSISDLAGQVAEALSAPDLSRYADLLAPDVQWGPPGMTPAPCSTREQVLAWYRRGQAAGARATVTETSVHGERILVGLAVTGRQGREGPAELRWQVLTVRDGRVSAIVGFDERQDALHLATTGELPTPL